VADVIDFLVALRTLTEHDVGIFGFGDIARAEREGYSFEANTEGLEPLAEMFQPFDEGGALHI
jgi:hypothetical protein